MSTSAAPKKLMLVAVDDRNGLGALGLLVRAGEWEIAATGKTAARLKELYISFIQVQDLHPDLLAAISARRNVDADMDDLRTRGIRPIDAVLININEGNTHVDEIPIDPIALLEAAVTNTEFVIVSSNPLRYQEMVWEMRNGGISNTLRTALMKNAAGHIKEHKGVEAPS